jgi:hypothetical protein
VLSRRVYRAAVATSTKNDKEIGMSDSYLPRWDLVKPATGVVVTPTERLPWLQTFAMGVQHVIAMFGATVLARCSWASTPISRS